MENPNGIQPFKFTPEQFTSHFSESDFGASYSVWIPWDAVGGEQKRVSLVATFQSTTGKFVQASPTTVILPGKNDAQVAKRDPIYSSQYRNHISAVENHATGPSGLVTTTIRRSADPANQQRIESRGLSSSRLDAMLAKARASQTSNRKTPFVDVPINQECRNHAGKRDSSQQ